MSPRTFAKVMQVVFSRVRSSSHLPIPSLMLWLQFCWSDLYTYEQTVYLEKWTQPNLFNDKRFIIYISCFTDYNFFLISEKILKLGFLFPAIIWNSGKNIFVLVVFFNKDRGPAISVDVNQCFSSGINGVSPDYIGSDWPTQSVAVSLEKKKRWLLKDIN